MLRFTTLGPEGGNHHFVLLRYLAAHGICDTAKVELIDDFHCGAESLIAGRADFMLQCAVHPDLAAITGGYRRKVVVVDSFISPSQPMALLRARVPLGPAGSVGAQPATLSYADLSEWPLVFREPTVSAVGDGLVAGRYQAGIAFTSLCEQHPDAFEVVEDIGAVCDAWLVFGTQPVDGGQAAVWVDSPVSRLYKPVR